MGTTKDPGRPASGRHGVRGGPAGCDAAEGEWNVHATTGTEVRMALGKPDHRP